MTAVGLLAGADVAARARGRSGGTEAQAAAAAENIHQAIRSGDIERVRAVLDRDVAAVRVRQDSIYPLHRAVRQGHRAVAELLISRGADVNQFGAEATDFSPNEFTPLTDAVRSGNMDMVAMLAEKGADLKRVTSFGESHLHFAAFMNRKEAVSFFIDRGIDVNARKRGDLTPLHLAAVMGFDDIVDVLVQKGAGLDVVSTDGGTPLHFAEAAGHAKTAALLRSKGARDVPRRFPRYAGAYLGARSPRVTPEPFVPELFRDIYRVHSVPAFSPDGREVYWECTFMRGNVDANRIWFMREENGFWTAPRVAPFSTYPSGGPAFFADGRSLVYFSLQPRDQSSRPAKDADLWIVERQGAGWSQPRHLAAPLNRDGSNEVYPYVARDGSIYLNQPPAGLVKSALVGGKYGEVETIGNLFEASAIDHGRAIDHILLYSDKIRPDRYEYEIYVSFPGADRRWSKPLLLGHRLHPGRRATQAAVTLDRKHLFFVSDFYVEWVDAAVLDQFRPGRDGGTETDSAGGWLTLVLE